MIADGGLGPSARLVRRRAATCWSLPPVRNWAGAEPSPDVTANAQARSATTAAVNLAVADYVSGGGEGGNETSASSEVVNVVRRTETVLVLRSAMYRICEMRLNGDIEPPVAAQMFAAVLETARNLSRRDNVRHLIAVLRSENDQITAEHRDRIIAAILSLSLTDAAQGLPENTPLRLAIERQAQEAADGVNPE